MVKMKALRAHLVEGGLMLKGGEFEVPEHEAKAYPAHLATRVGGGEAKARPQAQAKGSGLPDDFPAADKLRAAGVESPGDALAMSDDELAAVQGIGPATVRQIREWKPAD